MTVKTFVLTFSTFNMLKARGLIKACRNCGYAFHGGDVVVSKFGSKPHAYWYCRKCAIICKLI